MKQSEKIRRFDSVGALVRFIEEVPVNPRFTHLSSQRVDRGGEWSGTETWGEAFDLLRFGDPASAALLQSAAVKMRAADGSRRAFVDSVAGFAPNVPAYLRGLPLSMISKGTKTANNKVVDLVYNMAAASMVDKTEIAEAGAKILTAIQAAEKNGYRVNLYAGSLGQNSDGSELSGAFIKIKDSGTYITPSKIAFFLVNPSFLRRVIFAYWERIKLRSSCWFTCYGYPVHRGEVVAASAASVGIDTAAVILSANDLKQMTVQQIADRLTGAAK